MKLVQDLKTAQSLTMTPQLQQAIKLLQMSSQELQEYVSQEVIENPLLERKEEFGEVDHYDLQESNATSTDSLDEIRGENFENVWQSDHEPSSLVYDVKNTSNSFSMTYGHNIKAPNSLRDELVRQLYISIEDKADRELGENLIDCLDENGYLARPLPDIVAEMGWNIEAAQRVLVVLQTFEPVGVFAGNLKECLRIQLKDKGLLTTEAEILLENLDFLLYGDIEKLAKSCQMTLEECQDLIAVIRSLDPKPALNFEQADEQVLIPDVLMSKSSSGGWGAELNPDASPSILVNSEFYEELRRQAKRKEDLSYLQDKFTHASWLMRALQQRAVTVLKVAQEIITTQEAFFKEGAEALKPLILKDIADKIDMHESTISRVTKNKYIATPRGVFELKYFFTSKLAPSVGNFLHSAKAVQQRIKTLVQGESRARPMSDDMLVKVLNAEGIQMARRTVTKYREALRIESSVNRRRRYKLEKN